MENNQCYIIMKVNGVTGARTPHTVAMTPKRAQEICKNLTETEHKDYLFQFTYIAVELDTES